jgi:SWI/SNF-related matrix-associated actin-dependent regulator 1 of chromatin subfamily A
MGIRYIDVSDDGIRIEFPYDPHLVDIVKSSVEGRKFDPKCKVWTAPLTYTNANFILKMAENYGFVLSDKDRIEGYIQRYSELVEESNSIAEPVFNVEGLNLPLRPYQRTGVKYMLDNKKCIVGDEMGIGKTVEAIAAIYTSNLLPSLVVCPATIKLNWQHEIEKWTSELEPCVINSVSDIGREDLMYITNYESLDKYLKPLMEVGLKSLIFDEAHWLKTPSSKRTKLSLHLSNFCQYVWLLTGTPVLNRPSELIPLLQIVKKLDQFGGWFGFVKRYCAAYQKDVWMKVKNEETGMAVPVRKKIWDTSGSSNLRELNEKLRGYGGYIRRSKDQVLTELPPKQIAHVYVDITNPEEYDDVDGDETIPAMLKVGKLYVEVGRGKIQPAIEWIKEFLDSEEKLVVFTYHKEMSAALIKAFPDAAHIVQEDSQDERYLQSEKFQDPNCQLIICSIKVAGLGLNNLKAASNILMTELWWTFGELRQCEDRCHRDGQTKPVTVYYLLGDNTIDKYIMDKVDQKREIMKESSESLLCDENFQEEIVEIYKQRGKKRKSKKQQQEELF